MIEEPINIQDDRVGKHFEHARYGTTYLCEKAVMYNGYKFLTLIQLKNSKKDKLVSAISWCISNETSDADFFMNFMEM